MAARPVLRAPVGLSVNDALFGPTDVDWRVFSLNVPVPSEVARLAAEVSRHLPEARPRGRGNHSLVCKRLGTEDDDYPYIETRAREALAGTAPFVARVTEIDTFEDAVTGSSPVVYLTVESTGLEELHSRLSERFDPLPNLEGDAYTPHVTIARGGSRERAHEVSDMEVDPVEWTVTTLQFRDAKRSQAVSTVSLPA